MNLKFRGQLPDVVGAELDNVTASMRAFLTAEHNDDGSHGDITASSLTLQGASVGTIDELAYDSARFFCEGLGTWTVGSDDLTYLRASRIGQLVFVQFNIQTTVITTDTPESLFIRLPEFHAIPKRDSGGSPSYQVGGILFWGDIQNSTSGIGQVSALAQDFANAAPSTLLQLDKLRDGTSAASMFGNWAISNNLWLQGSCWFVVEPDNAPVPFYGA